MPVGSTHIGQMRIDPTIVFKACIPGKIGCCAHVLGDLWSAFDFVTGYAYCIIVLRTTGQAHGSTLLMDAVRAFHTTGQTHR